MGTTSLEPKEIGYAAERAKGEILIKMLTHRVIDGNFI